jgi:hypothetical protein
MCELRHDFLDDDEPVRFAVRQRTEQHAIDDGKHGGGGADGQRQRQDDGDRVCGIAPKALERVTMSKGMALLVCSHIRRRHLRARRSAGTLWRDAPAVRQGVLKALRLLAHVVLDPRRGAATAVERRDSGTLDDVAGETSRACARPVRKMER